MASDHDSQNVIKSLVEGQVERLADNVVNYEVYPQNLDASGDDLKSLRAMCLQQLEAHLRDYIWQCDRFELQPSSLEAPPWESQRPKHAASAASGDASVPRLWGFVRFGENIEDEWFVTWLLFELTRHLPITARVWDNDGEFLLIEAAYVLPRWIKPDVARDRVWLHGGRLHIVPLPKHVGDPSLPAAPNTRQALEAIRSGSIDTESQGDAAHEALQVRLGRYPAYAKELMHRSTFILPARLAHVLHKEPQLTAAAVEALYYRDPSDIAAARKMQYFPPQDMVTTSVLLNRCLYAQLALQQYVPPKGYPMPFPSDKAEYAAAEAGAKLVAGFEAVLAREPLEEASMQGNGSSNPSLQQQQQLPSEETLRNDPGWQAHKDHLQRIGFFPDALPGSNAYQAALHTAIKSYVSTEMYRLNTARLRRPAALLHQLMAEPIDVEALKGAEVPLPDDDAWLHEEPAEVEAELQRRQEELEQVAARKAGKQKHGDGSAAKEEGADIEFDPTEMASKLHKFLGGIGDAGGGDVDGGAVFDEERFAKELERVLGMVSGSGNNDTDSDAESSDEGSSFYSGSDDTDDDTEEGHDPDRPSTSAAARGSFGTTAGAAAYDSSNVLNRNQQQAWEAATATDSDDEGNGSPRGSSLGTTTDEEEEEEDFDAAYGQIMEQELATTKVTRSFKSPLNGADNDEESGLGDLEPVDVDVNLISNMLASYKEQAGMPGPAGNLAGLLGIKLPDPGAL